MLSDRKYQVDGEAAIFNAWKSGYKNVMYQLATGGGKTVVITKIIKKFLLKRKRTMFVAHREELIQQAWQTLYNNQIMSGIIKADIAPNFNLPSQVASIQTLARRTNIPPPDLIIIDEGHHSQDDNTYGRMIQEMFPYAYVLAVTATPYRLNGKGFTELFEVLVRGPQLSDLINMGYLTPLRYFIKGMPDMSNVGIQAGEYRTDALERAMDAKGYAPLIDSYMDHCRGMSGVAFAVNVSHSHKIVDAYNKAGVRAAHLDGETPTTDRKRILSMFKAKEISIISNVGIITEGFDFPDMEFVQLARRTKSLALFLQMVGRVTRVPNSVIKDAIDDDHRATLVSLSKKPYGIVLDNSGCYMEHGMPDHPHDWDMYFEGFDKRKRKKVDSMIEIIEFIAEDETTGRTVTTEHPEEIEGLKLIEVRHTEREKIVNNLSYKEFDKALGMFKNIPKVEKKGAAALGNFLDHCRKTNTLVTPDLWDYLYKRLWTDPQEQQAVILSERDQAISTLQKSGYSEAEVEHMTKAINENADKRTATVKKMQVAGGWIRKQQAEYESKLQKGVAKG